MTKGSAGSAAGEPARLPRKGRRCPICRAPAVVEWRPFCSKRCADADLGRWIAGDYRIPVVEDNGGEGEAGDEADEEGRSGRS